MRRKFLALILTDFSGPADRCGGVFLAGGQIFSKKVPKIAEIAWVLRVVYLAAQSQGC